MSDEPRRGPGRPKTVDRPRAIALAMETYWREGAHTLSLNEICRRVHLSKPALYREFGGQDGLMDAALAHYDTQVIAPVLAAFAADLPVSELIELLLVGMTSQRDLPPGCLFTDMRFGRATLGPQVEARVRSMEQTRRTVFEDWYRRGLTRGEVAEISPGLAATYIDTQLAMVMTQLGAGESAEQVLEQGRLAFRALRPATAP